MLKRLKQITNSWDEIVELSMLPKDAFTGSGEMRTTKNGQGQRVKTSGRWSSIDKENVTIAVRTGLMTLAEAQEKYLMHIDEFLEWNREFGFLPDFKKETEPEFDMETKSETEK